MKNKFFYMGILFSILTFSTQQVISHEDISTPHFDLTLKQVKLRSEQVSNVNYILDIALDKDANYYQGKVTLEFDFKKLGTPLDIEFFKGKILSLTVNDKTVTYQYNQQRITLPESALSAGKNKVDIRFEHDYSKTGSGLYRFVDKEDGNIYIYSDFEPFDANLMFPNFDQPNIKATFKLTVTAPESWQVISTAPVRKVDPVSQGNKTWQFEQTQKISSYVFSMHAGEYKMWEDNSGPIPLRLFARQSLAKYVDAKDWFKITQAGFKFFNNYFDYPYPFKKYDQLLVPDYNQGAMENIGAVTFNEESISKGKMDDTQRFDLIMVVYHEMAHMWFGNLVTMQWWNDLWLNESFATYMSYLAIENIYPAMQPWLTYYLNTKANAYTADNLSTTHPIATDIKQVTEVMSNFDAITYNKGGSFLKQLAFYVTPERFQKGMQHYMKTYAYQNTTLQNFLDSLTWAYGKDITPIADQWLLTTGFNSLSYQFKCDKQGGYLNQYTLMQSNEPLRKHRTKIAMFNASNDQLTQNQTKNVYYQNSQQIEKARSLIACPQFIFANADDEDYVMLILSPDQYTFVSDHLTQFNTPLTRAMLMNTLWWPVYQGDIPLTQFANSSLKMLSNENSLPILNKLLGYLTNINYYLSAGEATKKAQQEYIEQAQSIIWRRLISDNDNYSTKIGLTH